MASARLSVFAVATVVLASTWALAADDSCAAPETSLLPVPEWYAARCAGETAAADPSRHGDDASVFPGGLAIYKTMFPAPNGFFIGSLPPSGAFAPNSQPIFAMGFQPFDPQGIRLFAIDNTSRQLGIVGYGSGIFTPVAAIHPDPGPAFTVTGLAYDTTGAMAYVVASDGAPAGSRLFRIDLATAALTPVGTITNMPFIVDIAFDGAGQLYAHDIGGDFLVRVNKATAAPSIIGPTGLSANFAQGMMFDHTDGTLYGCAYVTTPVPEGRLVMFSLSTGAATLLTGPVPHEMECAVPRLGGPCIAPGFNGLAAASTAGTSTCAIQLGWTAGVPCGATTLKYNVYRSTTPGTPPGPATLLRSCLTTLSYTDTDVVGGTRYYYRVRAEDNVTSGNGPCNGGRMDANIVERSAAPTGPPTTDLDDVESGGGNWDTSGGTGVNPWTIVTTQSHSPTHSWFVADPATASDQRLRWIAPISVPIGGGELSFWHAYVTENSFDGHVLEYSLDGGTTWSDILGGQGSLPANATRFTLNGYDALIRPGAQSPLAGRQAWSGSVGFVQVRLDLGDFAARTVSFRFRFVSDASAAATGVWIDDVGFTVNAASCVASPSQAAAPEALAVDAAGNGVYQPNETVVVAPTWRNTGTAPLALTGSLANHTGPAGPTYAIPDAAASYGSIPVGGNGSCTAANDCYSVANTAASRPTTHWDTTVVETVTPTSTAKTWTLHVGNSFAEVAPSSPFFRFIEMLLHRGVTGGCTATTYCPSASATREQMAVFVLLSKEATGYVPPACVAGAEAFGDVPASSPFCRWIEELARRGVVSGCGGGNYCPGNPVSREQMAIFVLKTLDPALVPPACAPPNLYLDVPETSPFCRWIEELTTRGAVGGCGGNNYCPLAPVTREQMGVFLAVTFGLTLYGL